MASQKHLHAFTAVDSQTDPSAWIGCLDCLRAEPFYKAYKNRISSVLSPVRGGAYLEIGAGTGDDARNLRDNTGANVTALDISRTMARGTRRRGLSTVVVADAHDLPFPDEMFHGCWSDRTFQHLADPNRALDEMTRVTRPGGRVVVIDPDYDTQVMEFPDQELARRVLRFRADHGLRNGTLAHRMAGMFADCGLTNIRVEALPLIVRDPNAFDHVMGLRSWAQSAADAGIVQRSEVAAWEAQFDEVVAAGNFLWSVTFYLTTGIKGN
jgi:SAM-dependent methyltransferase